MSLVEDLKSAIIYSLMKHEYNENYSFFFFFVEKYVDFIQNEKDTKCPETQSFQYMMGFL